MDEITQKGLDAIDKMTPEEYVEAVTYLAEHTSKLVEYEDPENQGREKNRLDHLLNSHDKKNDVG